MSLSLLSFNYKTTPIEIREKLALSSRHLPELLSEARESCRLAELVVLSTCNRVEYYYVPNGAGMGGAPPLTEWLERRFFIGPRELESSVVALSQQPALQHLFRVASSLESMVIGEPQILGQVKEAFQIAAEAQTMGPVLGGLMPKVFRTAKRVRSETGIARFAVSVSYVAAELAAKIFESLEDKTVLVIGAGEMAELALTHLCKRGIRRLLVANRTHANAVALAERFQGQTVRFEEIGEHLAGADIVISSTGARGFILEHEMVRRAARARKGNPMFLIDIAVPRDIDPTVNELPDVYCYDIDDLQSVADANRAEREREAQGAQQIIDEEVQRYLRWQRASASGPLITALRRQFTELGQAEAEKTLARLGHLSAQDAEAVRRLVHGLLNKLLHVPSTRLKQVGEAPNGRLYAEAIATVFDLPALDGGAPEAPGEPAGEDAPNVVRFRKGEGGA